MFPHMTDDVVRHHGFYAIGQIAGHPWPPSGMRLKERPVNRDCQLLFIDNVADAAQAVLPPLCDSDRIERSDIELDPGVARLMLIQWTKPFPSSVVSSRLQP